MTDQRTIEDRLREEYFLLLPEIRRVTEQLESEVRYCVLPILRNLNKYERLIVKSRIKECESAVDSLRRRQEGGTFDRDRPAQYTLTGLKDLAGVRVLAFPRRRVTEVDEELRKRFESWEADPVRDADGQLVAPKYSGYCKEASGRVRGEYQVVPMLVGLFWEVEHSAIYKATPKLKGATGFWKVRERTSQVYSALRAFEEEFEALISAASPSGSD